MRAIFFCLLSDSSVQLRLANSSLWGHTVPLYFDWYRRKSRSQSEHQWDTWTDTGQKKFLSLARARYPRLFAQALFPRPNLEAADPNPPLLNPLQKSAAVRMYIVLLPPSNRSAISSSAVRFHLPTSKLTETLCAPVADRMWLAAYCLLGHIRPNFGQQRADF